MSRYLKRFAEDLNFYVEQGVLSAEQASAMHDMPPPSRSTFSLITVLMLFGGLLLGAALLSFIAANWEVIPRVVRLIFVNLLGWASFFAIAWALIKERAFIAHGAALFAFCVIGAGVALVGQMYHLTGDFRNAILLWWLASITAALLFRSPVLVAGAAVLTVSYYGLEVTGGVRKSIEWVPIIITLVLAAIVYIAAFRSAERRLFHILALCLGALIFYFAIDIGELLLSFGYRFEERILLLFSTLFAAAFFALHFWETKRAREIPFSHASYFYLAFFAFCFVIFGQLDGYGGKFITIVMVGPIVLAAVVAFLILKARSSAPVRWLCYLVFCIEVSIIYLETIGSLLGTSGFLLVLGLAMLAVAYAVIRIERRIKRKRAELEMDKAEKEMSDEK